MQSISHSFLKDVHQPQVLCSQYTHWGVTPACTKALILAGLLLPWIHTKGVPLDRYKASCWQPLEKCSKADLPHATHAAAVVPEGTLLAHAFNGCGCNHAAPCLGQQPASQTQVFKNAQQRIHIPRSVHPSTCYAVTSHQTELFYSILYIIPTSLTVHPSTYYKSTPFA
jgi:hypothetical protein